MFSHKDYYQKNKEYFKSRDKKNLRSPETIARKHLWNEIQAGRVTRGDCRICGKLDAEGHHEDYSKPFDVLWLCRTHHRRFHTGQSVAGMILDFSLEG